MIKLSDVLLFYHSDKKFIVKNESEVKWFGDFHLTDSDVSNLMLKYSVDYALHLLRIQRNQLLASTDWRMTTDYPYTDQSAWATYRTELRNLPATASPTLDENGNLTNVDWPTAPDDL